MEMCALLDEAGMRTGRIVARGTILPQGEYYLVVHVWIRNEAGDYLIQQRAAHLASAPGVWATTVGYVQANEDSISGAVREVSEELGIGLTPAQLRQFDRLKTENRIEDIWLVEVSRNVVGALALGPEVSDWKWASKAELEKMASSGAFFSYSYLEYLPT